MVNPKFGKFLLKSWGQHRIAHAPHQTDNVIPENFLFAPGERKLIRNLIWFCYRKEQIGFRIKSHPRAAECDFCGMTRSVK